MIWNLFFFKIKPKRKPQYYIFYQNFFLVHIKHRNWIDKFLFFCPCCIHCLVQNYWHWLISKNWPSLLQQLLYAVMTGHRLLYFSVWCFCYWKTSNWYNANGIFKVVMFLSCQAKPFPTPMNGRNHSCATAL